MKRTFSRRDPKKYVWVHAQSSSDFSATSVASLQLVLGADFTTQGGIGAQAHVLNVVRIIGDLFIQAGDVNDLDNATDTFSVGPALWGIYLQDIDDTTVLHPEDPTVSDETSLGTGVTEAIGLGIDTSAMVGGTGLGIAFAHQFPWSTVVHFDIRSNRRMNNDEQLLLNVTRPNSALFSLNSEADFFALMNLRVLVKLP